MLILAAWLMHTITAGSDTGPLRGADGVDVSADGCIVTPWEQGATITRACPPADPTLLWPTEFVATGIGGAEDAKQGDIDGDGILDVVSGTDVSASSVRITFRGSTNQTIALPASQMHSRVMQVAIADMNEDSLPDIVFVSRAGSATVPAVVAWLENPGFLARTGAAWPYREISLAGWGMSLLVIEGRVVVSDRSAYKDAAGVTRWDLYGARWLEHTPDGWVNRAISPPAGNCGALCTPGDEMMLTVVDWDGDGDLDVIDGTSSQFKANRIAIRRNTASWLSWVQELVPAFDGVGHYQAAAVGDINHDGSPDIVVSTWETNALPASTAIGVYWLELEPGGWLLHDVSGPVGSKFDNLILRDVNGDGWLDVITSEQVEQLGVVWYENPKSDPGAS